MTDIKEKKGLAFYIAFGMVMGALAGIIISILAVLFFHSVFLAVAGTGFGICAGVLVADIIYCLRNKTK